MCPCSKSPVSLRSRSGSVMIAVLVYIAFMAFVVVAFLELSTDKIKYQGLFDQRGDLRVAAYSGLDSVLSTIAAYSEVDEALWGPEQGWATPLEHGPAKEIFDDVTFHVEIEDQSGRIGIRDADYALLNLVLDDLGFDARTAQELANNFLDWVDSDDNQSAPDSWESEDYEDLPNPYRAANRPLESWDELRLIHGWREAFWDEDGAPKPELQRLRNLFSLHNEGPVNINTATPEVMAFLERLYLVDAVGIAQFKAGLDGIPGTADDQPVKADELNQFKLGGSAGDGGGAASGPGPALGVNVADMLVKVEARRGEARFFVNALVRIDGSAGQGGGAGPNNNDDWDGGQAPPPDMDMEDPQPQTGTGNKNAEKLNYPWKVLRLLENERI